MGVIGTAAAFIGLLVILVLVHELGHFVAAKRAGITVQEFGIGFPPRIGSVVWRGTRYSLNWIPLGGFVKMLGEDGDIEAQRMRQQGLSEGAIEQAMGGAFNRKPIWVRLVVLLAGVAMNFLLAIVAFSVMLSLPQPVLVGPLTVTAIQPGSPAAGVLRVGDQIVTADGRSFERSADLTQYVRQRAGSPVTLGVKRDGHTTSVRVTPRQLTQQQIQAGQGAVGFSWRAATRELAPAASNPLQAVWEGTRLTWDIALQIPGGLARSVAGLIGLAPNTGAARGPIGIAQATGEVLGQPLATQLAFVALLSVNLAVLNILPFPPLDGGRMAVTLLEAARRRRLSAQREALIYLTGFAVLIALVILISIQDIGRLPGS
jgi:regulator of sigma E protease